MVTKIVRDKIPGFFESEGKKFEVSRLDDIWGYRFRDLLADKIVEESQELAEAIRKEDLENIVEEYGDVLDVLDLIKTRLLFSDAEIVLRRVAKSEKAGGFVKGYVISCVYDS